MIKNYIDIEKNKVEKSEVREIANFQPLEF